MNFDPAGRELSFEQAVEMYHDLQEFERYGGWGDAGPPKWASDLAELYHVATGHVMVTQLPYQKIAATFFAHLDQKKLAAIQDDKYDDFGLK